MGGIYNSIRKDRHTKLLKRRGWGDEKNSICYFVVALDGHVG